MSETVNNSYLFQPGNDPRRNLKGRPVGALGDTTKAAMELLRAKAEEMIAKLTHIATNDSRENEAPCIACGRGLPRSEELQVKAIIAALDRCGLGPQSKIDMTVKDDTSWMRFLTDDQVDTLAGWIEAARQRSQEAPPEALVLEGVVTSAASQNPQGEAPAAQLALPPGSTQT
jgi:hypothetical protein